jgi:2-polyprenyl-3-methyl-5-hydroxy-6-metoxy-1,4-benzoquinol methylase
MDGWLHKFFRRQVQICRAIDARFFSDFALDGNQEFDSLVRTLIRPGSRIADVGGGKTPFFNACQVAEQKLVVTGVDMDSVELSLAPPNCYADAIVGRIEEVRGDRSKDYVVAQSVLEHVEDGRRAATGIASFARIGGVVATFCPNRRAWFARLNTLLPEKVKRAVLFFVFPGKRERQGFPAFYDGCTPRELRENMRRAGVHCNETRYYFTSSYFMFFVPAYLLWRCCTWPFMKLWPDRYCETFIFLGQAE